MAVPTDFPQATRTLNGGPAEKFGTAKDVGDLRVVDDSQGCIDSCWKLSWRERLSALIHGKVWLLVRAENTHAPVAIVACRSIFE
jgi:hypothetical protein